MYLVSVEANQSHSWPWVICDLTSLSGVANHFVNVWLCHTLNPKAGRAELKQPICTFVQHAPCPRTTDCVKVPWNLVSKDRWRYLGPNPKSCEMSDAPRVGFRADARSGWPCPLVESWSWWLKMLQQKTPKSVVFKGSWPFPVRELIFRIGKMHESSCLRNFKTFLASLGVKRFSKLKRVKAQTQKLWNACVLLASRCWVHAQYAWAKCPWGNQILEMYKNESAPVIPVHTGYWKPRPFDQVAFFRSTKMWPLEGCFGSQTFRLHQKLPFASFFDVGFKWDNQIRQGL